MKRYNFFRQQFNIVKDMCDSESGFRELEELQGDIEITRIEIDYTRDPEFRKLSELKDEIRHFIEENQSANENPHYDPEAELDRMFPDRYDDDFDEDSMSWDSVFGED